MRNTGRGLLLCIYRIPWSLCVSLRPSMSVCLFVCHKHEPIQSSSGVATGWTGVDMSTPRLLVTPEIDTNPTNFYGGVRGSLHLQTPVIGSRSALAMSVHPTYFDLATPLNRSRCRKRFWGTRIPPRKWHFWGLAWAGDSEVSSVSEVTTLLLYTRLFINIIIITYWHSTYSTY